MDVLYLCCSEVFSLEILGGKNEGLEAIVLKYRLIDGS